MCRFACGQLDYSYNNLHGWTEDSNKLSPDMIY